MPRSAKREQYLRDCMATMVGGAIRYWAQVTFVAKNGSDYTSFVLYDLEDEKKTKHRVSGDVLEKGFQALWEFDDDGPKVELNPEMRGRLLASCVHSEPLDWDGADVLLQIALFGEVKYG